MTEQARRKELIAQYKRTHPEAGVYRIVNSRNNKALLGSTPNLASIRGKLEFARATGSLSVLDHRHQQSTIADVSLRLCHSGSLALAQFTAR